MGVPSLASRQTQPGPRRPTQQAKGVATMTHWPRRGSLSLTEMKAVAPIHGSFFVVSIVRLTSLSWVRCPVAIRPPSPSNLDTSSSDSVSAAIAAGRVTSYVPVVTGRENCAALIGGAAAFGFVGGEMRRPARRRRRSTRSAVGLTWRGVSGRFGNWGFGILLAYVNVTLPGQLSQSFGSI